MQYFTEMANHEFKNASNSSFNDGNCLLFFLIHLDRCKTISSKFNTENNYKVKNPLSPTVICYPPSEPPPSAVHPFSSLLQSFYDEKASKSYLDTLPAIQASSDATYHAIWNLHTTAPLFLIIILFPLISLKSPTFFTKFTAFGKFMKLL